MPDLLQSLQRPITMMTPELLVNTVKEFFPRPSTYGFSTPEAEIRFREGQQSVILKLEEILEDYNG
jgi:hypothetical protein